MNQKNSTIFQRLKNLVNKNIEDKDQRIKDLTEELNLNKKIIYDLEQTQNLIEKQFQIQNEQYKKNMDEIKDLKNAISILNNESSLSLKLIESKEHYLKEYKIYSNALEKELDRSNNFITKILKKGKFKRKIIDIKEIEIG